MASSPVLTSVMPEPKYWPSALDLLCCAICDRRYRNPKVLPCLHTFCQQCLCEEIPSQSLSVTCPLCRQQSILPVNGVQDLQSNTFITNLLNVLNSPESCHCCGDVPSRLTSKCLDCHQFLCENCRLQHITMSIANSSNNNSSNNGNNLTHISHDHDLNDDNHTTTSNGHTQAAATATADSNHCHHSPDDRNNSNSNVHDVDHDALTHPHNIVSLEELCLSATAMDGSSDDVTRENGTGNGSGGGGGGGGGNSIVCPNHAGNPLKYYCSHCETAVCETCTQTEHIGHLTLVLSEAVTEHKTSLTSLVSRVRQMTPQVTKAIQSVEETTSRLISNQDAAKVKISTMFDELSTLLESRRENVLTQMSEMAACKEQVLHTQKKSLKQHLLRISDLCELTQDSLEHGQDTDVVMVKKEVARKLNDLLTNGPVLEPETNDLAVFDDRGLDHLQDVVSNIGSIPTNMAVPYCSSAGGEGLSNCVAGKLSTVTVTTRDKNGDPVPCGLAPLDVYISTDKTEERIIPDCTDQDNGTYDLTFTLPSSGVYYLSVFMFGQHTRGSPYKVRAMDASESNGGSARVPRTMAVKQKGVKRPSSSRSQGSSNRRTNRIEDDLIMRIGVKGRNKGEFFNPQGLCFGNDRVLVADSNNQNVQVFASSGECRLKFGNPGRVPGKVQRPTGVAVTHHGNYLVADYDNRWVGVFDDHGKYINRIGFGRLLGPKGVAVDREGRIVVVDNKASTIFVFQSNGKFLHKFGSRGNNDNQFAGPHYAAITKKNDVVITDFHNHCVKVFDSDGHFKFVFGSNGEGNGQFNAPTGVAVDEKDNILVADWGNSRIQVFDATGSFLSYINTASEPLYGPQGLAITSQGIVVVADSGNHCIKYYKYLQ